MILVHQIRIILNKPQARRSFHGLNRVELMHHQCLLSYQSFNSIRLGLSYTLSPHAHGLGELICESLDAAWMITTIDLSHL